MANHSNRIGRREFLKMGAAASALAVSGCPPAEKETAVTHEAGMRYRPLGGTGLKVSEVSFGAHGVDNPTLMAASLEAGINTFCTSGRYLDGREETALGEAIARIGAPRDKIVILTGSDLRPNETVDSWLEDLDASLQRLRCRPRMTRDGSAGSLWEVF